MTSPQWIAQFTVTHLDFSQKYVNILSVSRDGQRIIIGMRKDTHVTIYSTNGQFNTSISLPPDAGTLSDAVWATHSDHIICGTQGARLMIVLSTAGEVIARHQLKHPVFISASVDGRVMILSQYEYGISYSEDDGMTWEGCSMVAGTVTMLFR